MCWKLFETVCNLKLMCFFDYGVCGLDALPEFVRLLQSKYQELQVQCIWSLGNISGDCAKCRDSVLRSGALKPILKYGDFRFLFSIQTNTKKKGRKKPNNSNL